MESAGLDRIVRAEDVAHMGITEVIRHMPRIYGSYRRLVASIKKRRPDAAILIDFPDVNFRLARQLKKLGIPVIYFVSPQLWAWKRRRLRWVQQRVDRMMVIFPFEERFYRARGVDAKFVGHPLAELPKPTSAREAYAAAHGLDPAKPWIALLPGSRWKEILANLEPMVELTYRFPENCNYILPVASTIDPKKLATEILGHDEWLPNNEALEQLNIRLVPDAREALHHARASVVASGTATVQAAIIGTPFLVVYRVSRLTFWLAKRLIHYPPEIWNPTRPDPGGNLPIAMGQPHRWPPDRPRTTPDQLHSRKRRHRSSSPRSWRPRARPDDRRPRPGWPHPATASWNILHQAGLRRSRITAGGKVSRRGPKFASKRLMG